MEINKMSKGFIKLYRTENTVELMKYPNAFTLLSVIAYRARRSNSKLNIYKLEIGEALIGDYQSYGMSQKGYRLAKEKLKKLNLAAFKGTTRGTIAKLIDNSIYDINIDPEGEQHGEQGGEQRANEGATNKNVKNGKNDKEYIYGRKNQSDSERIIIR